MKIYLLLTLLILSVACKKTNLASVIPADNKVAPSSPPATPNATPPVVTPVPIPAPIPAPPSTPSVPRLIFDNSAYLIIPHQEDQSILRRKLLNLALTEQLKKTGTVSEAEVALQIKSGDEFNFTNDLFKSSSFNLENYKKLKANGAQVIVSYKDRLEIFFAPAGIERDIVFAQLGVVSEPEAKFSWVGTPDKILDKNKIYYLLNATKVNLKENDVYFNQDKISLGANFNEKILSFFGNQILEISLNVDYSIKETALARMTGSPISCKRDQQEAGSCPECSYDMEALTGRYINKALDGSEFIDVDIIVNGTKYRLTELNPSNESNGKFKVVLNLKKLIKTDIAIIQIHQNPPRQVLKTVEATTPVTCRTRYLSNVIDVTPSIKINLELNVKGRALNF